MDGMGFESFSRDLLRRFGGNGNSGATQETTATGVVAGDSDDIELSLGLSLGGYFGEDPAGVNGKKLVRSSSIASFSSYPAREPRDFPFVPSALLMRTSSLPTETEEDRRKRKEIESLKRLEAKRKRLERRNSMKSASKGVEKFDEDVKDVAAGKAVSNCNGSTINGLPAWMSPAMSQRSIGSQGSSSVGASPEFDKRAIKGYTSSTFNGCTESNNLSMLTVRDHLGKNKASITSVVTSVVAKAGGEGPNATRALTGDDSHPKKDVVRRNGANDIERNMMEEMPCVSARGEGPNGTRIEGFLYKYRKGEDLRIVCVCHGSFFTPAEFVKHAGGGDVAHPLRHIVVNPTPPVL